jgi:hypothetical protein
MARSSRQISNPSLAGRHDIEDDDVRLQLADPFYDLLTGQFMVNYKTMLVQIVND